MWGIRKSKSRLPSAARLRGCGPGSPIKFATTCVVKKAINSSGRGRVWRVFWTATLDDPFTIVSGLPTRADATGARTTSHARIRATHWPTSGELRCKPSRISRPDPILQGLVKLRPNSANVGRRRPELARWRPIFGQNCGKLGRTRPSFSLRSRDGVHSTGDPDGTNACGRRATKAWLRSQVRQRNTIGHDSMWLLGTRRNSIPGICACVPTDLVRHIFLPERMRHTEPPVAGQNTTSARIRPTWSDFDQLWPNVGHLLQSFDSFEGDLGEQKWPERSTV